MKSQKVVAVLVLACAALTSGCVAYGSAEAETPVVFVDDPVLVAVDDDVWVVRDYDRAVYFVGDSYWVYRDTSWYRSDYYDRGWTVVTVNVVPPRIARRRHALYVNYRGDAQARTRRAPASPGYRDNRGHRDNPGHRDRPDSGSRQRPAYVQPRQGERGPPRDQPTKDERKRDKKRDHDR